MRICAHIYDIMSVGEYYVPPLFRNKYLLSVCHHEEILLFRFIFNCSNNQHRIQTFFGVYFYFYLQIRVFREKTQI